MRVLHMSSEKGWRGGEQQLAYLLEDLSSANVKNVLAVKSGSGLEKFSAKRQIPSYALGFSSALDVVSAIKVTRICRREQIDLIHLHSSKAQGVGVLSALFGNRVPMILSRRVAFLPGSSWLSKWKYNQKQIKKIVCVSDKITDIMQRYVRDASKCVTVYSGIDLRKFNGVEVDRESLVKEFGLSPDRMIIVTIGAIDRSKDHFTFVDTIESAIAQGSAVQGLVIGDGPLAPALRAYVAKKKLERYVRLAGHRSDVHKLLASADMFLMTSKEEGLGTSLLDAFLARIPVVATDAGGIPEIVRDMKTGLLAPVGDAATLSRQIIRLLNDEPLRQRLVDGAYAFVKNFSKEQTSSRTLKIYREVLGR